MNSIFSIAAMFILFRETLEAAVIISVMLQLCNKLKLHKLKKWGASRHFSGLRSFQSDPGALEYWLPSIL